MKKRVMFYVEMDVPDTSTAVAIADDMFERMENVLRDAETRGTIETRYGHAALGFELDDGATKVSRCTRKETI